MPGAFCLNAGLRGTMTVDFAIYCFDSGNVGPLFVENWGHNFGHTSSVSNYWRTPLLCCQADRHFLAIPVDHYCDDYVTPDFALASLPDCCAAAGLSGLHDALGLIPPWQPGQLWPSRLQRGWMRSAPGFTRRPSPLSHQSQN